MAAPMEDECDRKFDEINKKLLFICNNDNNLISEEVYLTLKHIAEQFRKDEARKEYEKVHRNVTLILQNCLSALNSSENRETVMNISAELYRCLRNAFAVCTKNQDLWISSLEHCINLVNLFTKTLNLSYNTNGAIDTKVLITLRCGAQCLGNFVTNNTNAKIIIWDNITDYVCTLLNHEDSQVSRYSSMLVFNCLVGMPESRQKGLSDKCFAINFVETLCKLVNQDIEWSLYTLEYLIESEIFFEEILTDLLEDSRFIIFDIVGDMISKAETSHSEKVLPLGIIQYLTADFLKKSDIYILKHTDINSSFHGGRELVKILGILCSASACNYYRPWLQANMSLLISCLYILKAVQMAGQQNDSLFKPVGKLLDAANTNLEQNPVFGFKRDLVRLIGNMSWKHRGNQDKIRELEGISLLLDCTRIDAKNPFITQWVLFAIRNLCDGNNDNKTFIARMKKEGTMDADVLNELGVHVEKMEDGNVRVGGNSKRSQDEIDELFN